MSSRDSLLREISARFGLLPRDSWGTDLEQALVNIARRFDCSADDVVQRVASSPQLLRELAGCLTVQESFLLRNPEQFEMLAEYVSELRQQQPQRQVMIWSAGCSSGEEPYSAAIALRERLGEPLAEAVEIVASDLNSSAIATAITGIYSRWSLRETSAAVRQRHLVALNGGKQHQVRPQIRTMVRFEILALQEHLRFLPPDRIDAILFRNVAIYLDPDALQRIFDGFARVIRPGGLLIMAPTDPAPPRQLFAASTSHPSVFERFRPTPTIAAVATPPIPLARPYSPPAAALSATDMAMALGNQGRLDEALTAVSQAVEGAPGGRDGYLMRGKIQLAALRYEQAVADLRRALFLDPESYVGRFWYVQALHLAGKIRQAMTQVRLLVGQLEVIPGSTVLEDGRTTAGELLQATRFWRKSIA